MLLRQKRRTQIQRNKDLAHVKDMCDFCLIVLLISRLSLLNLYQNLSNVIILDMSQKIC